MRAESLMKFPRFFQAHFIARAHGFQAAVQITPIPRISRPRQVLNVGVEKDPIFRRSPVHDLDEFSAAHAKSLVSLGQ